MSETLFLGPEQEKTRLGRGRSWLSPSLPPELQDEAVRRIQWVSLAAFCSSTCGLTFSHFIPALAVGPPELRFALYPPLSAFSLGLAVAARWRLLAPGAILALGLVYKIAGAAVLAALVNSRPWPVEALLLGWSPVAVWALIFPILVPSSTSSTFVTSLLALAMDPLAVWLFVRLGVMPMPSSTLLLQRFLPHVVALVLSILVARTIHRLGSKLSAARELGSYRLVERLGSGGMGEVSHSSRQISSRGDMR